MSRDITKGGPSNPTGRPGQEQRPGQPRVEGPGPQPGSSPNEQQRRDRERNQPQ